VYNANGTRRDHAVYITVSKTDGTSLLVRAFHSPRGSAPNVYGQLWHSLGLQFAGAQGILMNSTHAFHGGKSFEAIGEDFQHLDRATQVINADVLDAWFDPFPCVLSKIRDYLPFLVRTSPPVYSSGLVTAIAHARGIPLGSILMGAVPPT
jgi:hypothetical protein